MFTSTPFFHFSSQCSLGPGSSHHGKPTFCFPNLPMFLSLSFTLNLSLWPQNLFLIMVAQDVYGDETLEIASSGLELLWTWTMLTLLGRLGLDKVVQPLPGLKKLEPKKCLPFFWSCFLQETGWLLLISLTTSPHPSILTLHLCSPVSDE